MRQEYGGPAYWRTLGWPVIEGDDLHPADNIARMSKGTPLTDADRAPWLDRIANQVREWGEQGQCGIVTCSSLKRKYRERISGGSADVCFVYLKGSKDDIAPRLRERTGHFMPPAMLDSQFETLEEPDMHDEVVLELDVTAPQEHLADLACTHLSRLPRKAGRRDAVAQGGGVAGRHVRSRAPSSLR